MNVKISGPQEQPTAVERLNNKITGIIRSNVSVKEMRRFVEMNQIEDRNQLAAVMDILRRDYGFTAGQLGEFCLKIAEANETALLYTMQMLPVPEIAALKEYGVDIEALEKEYISGEEDV